MRDSERWEPMKTIAMQTNSNFPVVASGGAGFCSQLSAPALRDFQSRMVTVIYPENSILFEEEEALRGVFVLRSGLVKLSVSSALGKNTIIRLARPGGILGLSAAISGQPYGNLATAVHRCESDFVCIEDFSRFLAGHTDAYATICRELVSQQSDALEQLRIVSLSGSVSGRLANLLLEWSVTGQPTKEGIRVKMPLTHEEIGEFIGASRETISRTLGQFKSRHLVATHGATLMISNRAGLEELGAAIACTRFCKSS
jgi:CRP/FNR family cyclic AMP-dependent transcriptional regulator